MTLKKSMLVAKTDLKMAMKVNMVKYGLLGIGSLGPIMMLAIVALMVYGDPVIGMLLLPSISTMLAPMLGMIAVIPASMIAANALVGEREMNTLEPLLSTPLTDHELLIGKLLSSFIPSMALLLGSIAVSEIGTFIILLSVGAEFILIPGIPGLFLLFTSAPLLIVAMVSVMILISGKVKRVYEAYQTTGALVMLFIVPMILPMMTMTGAGVVDMNTVWMTYIITILITLVLAASTWTLAVRKFNRDTMVSL
ncbi:MAG: ABC transporter permease subunit [Candidatus Thorarchaeota archaeon]